jgi:hypothetical protein
MKARVWALLVAVALIAGAVAAETANAAGGTAAASPAGSAGKQLTPEQQAVLDQAKDLGKQVRIAQLELRLAELKEEPEGRIAEKAEQLYRLQGRLHALMVKHPEVARALGRERARQEWAGPGGGGPGRRGGGLGLMGRGGIRGMSGLGRAWGDGQAMGRGRGGLGRALGAWGPAQGAGLRERARLRLHQPPMPTPEGSPAAPQPAPRAETPKS